MVKMNMKSVLKVILLRRLNREKKQRSQYMRSIFNGRVDRGESFLIRELREDQYYHFRYFRMNKENYDEILNLISDDLGTRRNHRLLITKTEKLAVTLRYLASGNSQLSIGLSYRISPQSVSNIVREVMNATCKNMGPLHLPVPTTEIWKNSEEGFHKIWNFPNACGAMDGKHVKVRSPNFSGSKFYNYKNFYSIVLLGICDRTI